MDIKIITNFLEKLAPNSLAYKGEEMGFIHGVPKKDISVMGVTWRPTVKVLREAVERHVELLITHEPLFQSKKNFIIDASLLKYPPNQKRADLLKQGNISVYRYHSQWDDAKEGNNETLAELFNLRNITKIDYGRIGEINPCPLPQFVSVVKKVLGCDNVLVSQADETKEVRKVAVISGSGNSLTEMIEIVKQKGADVLVSGDVHDSKARFAVELGLTLVDAGGYFTEKPGIQNLTKILQENFPELQIVFLDPGAPWTIR
jgi:dinuclear metal center YbgI/SA1388 family protein